MPIDFKPENVNYSNHLKGCYCQLRADMENMHDKTQKYETNVKYDIIRRHTRFIKQKLNKQKRQNWNQDFT